MIKSLLLSGAACLGLTFLISSCTGADEERAKVLYAEAEQAYQAGDWQLSALKLDTIEHDCKRAIEWRKAGHRLNYKVQLAQQEDSLATADTMLLAVTKLINEMVEEQHFVYVKSEYDELGHFYIQGTEAENNLNRCYVHAVVDEYGNTQLISEYRGPAYIHHTQLRFTAADGSQMTTQCVPLENEGANYRFKNLGMFHESVTYVNDSALMFVDAHATDSRLRAHLMYKQGVKSYFVEMPVKDRMNLVYTYQLGRLLAAQLLYTQRSQVAGKKIQFLKAKIETDGAAMEAQ